MKILILALSGIGDALMFTPALKLLRKTLPDAEIDALVMFKGVKDMYERNPNINKVLHRDFMNENPLSSLNYVLKLRGNYDASINVYPSNRKEYNIINFLIGARKRAGVKYLLKDAQNLGGLNNVRVQERDYRHNVQTNIRQIEKLLNVSFEEEPDLEFYLTDQDEQHAAEFFRNNGIKDDDLVIGFHPGCATLKNHIRRRWEPEKFAELAEKLINERNAKIILFGGPEEKDLKRRIYDEVNNKNIFISEAGSLAASAAAIKKCGLFITNDSSLMHVASAMKRKVIAIIGPTNPAFIHPWNTEHNIVSLYLECAPCFYYSPRPLICFRDDVKFKCIKELTTDMVYSAAVKFL